MKSIYTNLIKNGVKVTPIKYRAHGKLVSIGFDAHDGKNGSIKFEPMFGGIYRVEFDGFDNNPHRFGWNKNWDIKFYGNKKDGYQPILTKPIFEMKKDIYEFFEINIK